MSEIPYRPEFPELDTEIDVGIIALMKYCWNEVPSLRPSIGQVKKRLTLANNGRSI